MEAPAGAGERKPLLSGPLTTLLAGGVAGAVSRTAVAPLERLKILFQVQVLSQPSGASPRYTSVSQALTSLWQREGIRGLFKGNATNCQRIVPQSGIQFVCFDFFALSVFDCPASELSPLQRLFTGGLAGAVAATCTYPMDLIRVRISVDFRGEYSGLFGGMRKVAAEEGAAALYRGLVPSLVGIVPYIGVDFMVFGELKKRLADDDGHVSVASKLLAGGVAGVCGQTVAFPLDTVRRILQVQSMSGGRKVKEGNPTSRGMIDCMRGIVRRHGLVGLYHGYAANLLKAAPQVAVSFAAFEKTRELLEAL